MQFSKGSKLKIRRSPNEPVQDAIVIDIVVAIGSDSLGVRILLEIKEQDSPRPNEQVWLGAFQLKMWAEWSM